MPTNAPIGITFIPSDENAAQGPQRGALEGQGGSDLADAFKILSLRLPRVLGARALSSRRLLTGPGSAGIPGAFNPHAAVFEALLNAQFGGGGDDLIRSLSSLYGGQNSVSESAGLSGAPFGGETRIIPGQEGHKDEPYSGNGPSSTSWTPPTSGRLEDIFTDPLVGRRRY